MTKYCADCKDEVQVMEETIEGEDYISCPHCGTVIAKLDYDWVMPFKTKDGLLGPKGSTGSTRPIEKHHTLEDFKDGYFPHVMCCVGAMCADCQDNLK